MPKDLVFSGGYIEIKLKEKNHKHTPHCHVHFHSGASIWVSIGSPKERVVIGKAKAKDISIALDFIESFEESLVELWRERHGK